MKKTDKSKIVSALHEIRKFKWQDESNGGNDFKKGMASVAELMLDIIDEHGNSNEYQSALAELVRRSKTGVSSTPPLPPSTN